MTTTRVMPLFTLLAIACGQPAPSHGVGSGGTTASGGGTPTTGSGGKTGGSASSSAGTSGSGGGSSGSVSGANGGAAAGSGSSAGGAANIGGGGSGAGTGTAGAGGSSGTAGNATGGSAGMSGGNAGGQGQGGDASACPTLPTAPLATSDIIQFNDNGGWCWYQDERALVDTKAGKFVIGSVASTPNAGARDSDQEVVIYDIATGDKKRYTLETDLNPDDHNAPAFILRPDGGYAALWATHRDTCYSYYSTFDGTAWAAYKKYDWTPNGCPWDTNLNPKPDPPHEITYANPWYLSAEGKAYAGVRSVSTSPALLVSSDAGSSWGFYGRLTSTKTVGYVAGYYKYWGNGTDRIDFFATQAHPRDDDNSLWHGYYQGGALYNTKGEVVDSNVGDTDAKDIGNFTPVFTTGTTLNGVKLCRMWNHDVVRYADGTIAATGQGRTEQCDMTTQYSDPDKRIIYSRWDGTSWKSTYLVKAGTKLYKDEEDYTGLSAVHPDNPHVIFVSTTIDPRDDKTDLKFHEIFMGVTCDNGATWQWSPITQGSKVENIRPIVPHWDTTHTLLLWLRGSYTSAQRYDLEVVGTTALAPTIK